MPLILLGLSAAFAGDVFVKATEEGARIYLNGEDTGQVTPAVLEGLPAGSHEIKVLGSGCLKGITDVTVREHAIERVDLEMYEGKGRLTVLSTPIGASVAVDGRVLGETPLEMQPVACGPHQVEVTRDGYRSEQQSLVVGVDEEVELVYPLKEAETGTLVIMVQPLDAEVRIDDQPVGVGPMTLEEVDSGQRQVTATADGFQGGSQVVTVERGAVAKVDLTLQPAPRLADRMAPLKRVRWGTVGGGAALLGAGVGMGLLSLNRWNSAVAGYDAYSQLTYADQPQAYYQQNVVRFRRQTWAFAGTAGVLGVAGVGTLVFLPIFDPQEPGLALTVRF